MTTARLYGRFFGNTSLAVVARGFESALAKAGILAGTCNVEAEESEDDERAGADARHGIFVGPLGKFDEMRKRGNHEHHWLMVTPNSDRLPQDLIQILRKWNQDKGHHLMAPSMWAGVVVNKELHEAGIDGRPTHVVPHGVSEKFRPSDEIAKQIFRDYEEGQFYVIHFSTSARQRKGTLELIEAWGICGFGVGARLLCVMDHEARDGLLEAMDDAGVTRPTSVAIVDRADFPPEAMAKTLSRSHVVCQPSRGEGFGLVPLEALACGVPVIATAVTGHSEYMSQLARSTGAVPGLVRVSTGDFTPIDDLPGSSAPSMSSGSLANALVFARSSWPRLQEQAMNGAWLVQRDWSWHASLAPFIERLRVT